MAFGTSIKLEWVRDPQNIIYRILRRRETQPQKAYDVLQAFSFEVEDYMKENAPWNDRSGAARESLRAIIASRGQDRVTMEAGYDQGVMLREQRPQRNRLYDIYLEGYLNLSILQPTFDYKFPDIMDKLPGAGFMEETY